MNQAHSIMKSGMEELSSTAFTVSVDSRHGLTTGISAEERCNTVRALANGNSGAMDFVRPGHVFPLRARRWQWWEAVGRERTNSADAKSDAWAEDSYAVLDADPEAVRQLAHSYGQNAVLVWDGAHGSIVWCDACLNPHCGVTGEGAP